MRQSANINNPRDNSVNRVCIQAGEITEDRTKELYEESIQMAEEVDRILSTSGDFDSFIDELIENGHEVKNMPPIIIN